MKFLRQPKKSFLCGQTCVAMLSDITIDQAIAVFGKSGKTNTKDMSNALLSMDIPHKTPLKRAFPTKEIPSPSILKVSWFDNNGSHWVIYKKGKVYDPAKGVFKLDKFKKE